MIRKQNTERIGDVLKQVFQENKTLRLKLAESRVIIGWYDILGPLGHKYTSSVYYRHGVLYVTLTSSIFRQELLNSHDLMIQKLNDYIKMAIVTKIIFR